MQRARQHYAHNLPSSVTISGVLSRKCSRNTEGVTLLAGRRAIVHSLVFKKACEAVVFQKLCACVCRQQLPRLSNDSIANIIGMRLRCRNCSPPPCLLQEYANVTSLPSVLPADRLGPHLRLPGVP